MSPATARVLGVLVVVFGLLVVRYSQRIGFGIADAIVQKPDLITDRRPPQQGLQDSARFFGRWLGVFLVPWGILCAVAGVTAVIDGNWL